MVLMSKEKTLKGPVKQPTYRTTKLPGKEMYEFWQALLEECHKGVQEDMASLSRAIRKQPGIVRGAYATA